MCQGAAIGYTLALVREGLACRYGFHQSMHNSATSLPLVTLIVFGSAKLRDLRTLKSAPPPLEPAEGMPQPVKEAGRVCAEFSEITRRNHLYQGLHRHNACYR
jgi:hypothetical protein